MKLVILLLIFAVIIVVGPIATIWSLNTLFPILNIPFSFDTWAAALLLGGALSFRRNKD